MPKPKIILVLAACASILLFAVQRLSQASSPNQTAKPSAAERQRNMTEAERQREAAKREAARRLELERKYKESQNTTDRLAERAKIQREEQQKKLQEAKAEFLFEKRALAVTGLTEEQWKLVKPKLEKVAKLWNLRELERSTLGFSLGSSSTSGTSSKAGSRPSEPRWQWDRPRNDKAPGELSDAQKIVEQLIGLLEKKNATPEEFKEKMAALRKARRAEEPENKKREKELSEAQEELRKGLTTRQEAALVLMRRL